MKKLTVLAAAFAAAVTTFAARAEDITMHAEKVAALQATMRAQKADKAEPGDDKIKGVDKTKRASKNGETARKKDPGKAKGVGKTAKAGEANKASVKKRSAAKGNDSGKAKAVVVATAAVKAKAPAKAKAPVKAKAAAKAKAEAKAAEGERERIDLTIAKHDDKLPDAVKTVSSDGSYSQIIARYASSYGVPVSLANAVIRVESNYRPNARGSAGEIGLMQIKPSTARMMGYSGSAKGLYNPETNIKFGMKYLGMAHQLGGGTTCGTILKYNAGHGARRMNPVSSAYCSKVKRHLAGV
jgi:soluble lytic murein transglycosylase-like protein